MSEPEEMLPGEEEALRQLLARLRESAARREPLLSEEKELILAVAAELKASGHSAVELIIKMASAEEQLRQRLGVGDGDDRWPSIEELLPLLAGSRAYCRWPASDFIYAPTVLNWLGFLRQQNDPWIGTENSISSPVPKDLERILWSEDAPNALWRARLLAGANRDTETRLAPRRNLDRLAEAFRFNSRKRGRRHARTVAFLVERDLYIYFLAFLGLLKKGQRDTPKRLKDERSIREFLERSNYPRFLTARLAQELSEHRQRRRGAGVRLTPKDRAALMVAELEGKLGEYGLPEPSGPDELLGEDTSQPPSVALRRTPPGPFKTRQAEQRYERALERALGRAHGRIRQVKAIWNSGFVAPKPNKK